MTTSEHPLCPTCGLPTNEGLADGATVYECANEACPEYGQAVAGTADDVAPADG